MAYGRGMRSWAVVAAFVLLVACGSEASERDEYVAAVERATEGRWRDVFDDEDALVVYLRSLCDTLDESPQAVMVDPTQMAIEEMIITGGWCESDLRHD